MATPSLALGIGLQGKPIDRAAFNMQREIGAQKALQRKQEKELKELDPFKKQLVDLQSKAYLPAQKELLARETAKVYKYMADNIGNVDQWQLSQMIGDLANRSGLYQRNYIEAEKIRNNPKYQHIQGDIEKIFTVSNPEEFNNSFSGNPAFAPQLNELGGLVMQPFEAKSAQTTAQEFINIQKDNIFGPPSVETIDGIQKEVYRPKEGTFESVLNFTIKDPNTYRFEASNLFNQLAQSGNLPDLKTPEGQQQFDQMVKDKIANDIRSLTDFSKYERVPKGGGLVINNYPPTEKGGVLETFDTDVVSSYGGVELPARSMSTVTLEDLKRTVPPSSQTYTMTGERAKAKTGATYNQIGVSYVVKNPTEITITAQDTDFWNNEKLQKAFNKFLVKNKSKPGKRVYKFPKGMVIPAELEQKAVDRGLDIEAKVLAWALDANNNWIYEDATGSYQGQFLKQSDKEKPAIEAIKKRQLEEQKRIEDAKPKSNESTLSPNPVPSEPAPNNPSSGSRRENAISKLTPEQKKALGIK